MMKKFFSLLSLLVLVLLSFAQENHSPEAVGLRADGKIYVVGAVVLTILIGLLFYVIRIDRKIGRMEKNQNH